MDSFSLNILAEVDYPLTLNQEDPKNYHDLLNAAIRHDHVLLYYV